MITAQDIIAKIPAETIRQLTLALDADKTITRLDRSISSATKAAIEAVFAAGGKVGLCTGRALAITRHHLLPIFPTQSVHIVAGGALLVTQTGERIWGQEMSGKLVEQLLAAADRLGCGYGFGVNDKFYITANRRAGLSEILAPMQLYDAKEAPALTELKIPILVITELNLAMKQVLAEHENEISFKLMLDYKDEEYVDVTAVGVSKALGLEQLATYYQMPMEQIITVGDGLNDLEMIQAGFGVAMGNSVPELKEIAQLTIGDTDNDGLAEFIFALIEAKNILVRT